MESLDNIKNAIENNEKFNPIFKENLKNLMGALTLALPNYDYTKITSALSTLSLGEYNGKSYTNYDGNTLGLNVELMNADEADYQHLMLNEILLIGSGAYSNNEAYMGLNRGISEMISSTANHDASLKKQNYIPYLNVRVLSKVVGSELLIKSFMEQDYKELYIKLEQMGLSVDEITQLISNINNDNMLVSNEETMLRAFKNTNPTEEELSSFKEHLVLDNTDIKIFPGYENMVFDFKALSEELSRTIEKETNKQIA